MRNIQLKINLGFAQFAFFPVSLPSDTGHAPSLRKYIFGASIHRNPNEKVETRRAACRKQISTNMRNIQLKINLGFAQFAFFLVSFPSDTGHAPSLRKYIFGTPIHPNPNEKVETRRAACRQQISTNMRNIQLKINHGFA